MIIELIVLAMAVPVGYLLAYMARDELVEGEKWFRAIVVTSIILGVWFLITGFLHITYTCFFITIVSFISLMKSKDKKWVKK